MVLGLAAAYVELGGFRRIQGLFYGVGAAVIAIIARSAWKLVKLSVGRDPVLWVVFAASAGMTAWTEQEIAWLFVASGVAVMLARGFRPPAVSVLPWWLVTGLQGAADLGVLARLGLFFTEAGAFVFGSGQIGRASCR